MALPTVLAKQTTSLTSGRGSSAGRWNVLDLDVPPQMRDNWCWAAVALGIARAYGDAGDRRQCTIASDAYKKQCCAPVLPEGCDTVRPLVPVLGVHARGEPRSGPVSFATVAAAIDDGFPVAARLEDRESGKGHFVVISGYQVRGEQQFLVIAEPASGARIWFPYELFEVNGPQGWFWDETYFTTGKHRVRSRSNRRR